MCVCVGGGGGSDVVWGCVRQSRQTSTYVTCLVLEVSVLSPPRNNGTHLSMVVFVTNLDDRGTTVGFRHSNFFYNFFYTLTQLYIQRSSTFNLDPFLIGLLQLYPNTLEKHTWQVSLVP